MTQGFMVLGAKHSDRNALNVQNKMSRLMTTAGTASAPPTCIEQNDHQYSWLICLSQCGCAIVACGGTTRYFYLRFKYGLLSRFYPVLSESTVKLQYFIVGIRPFLTLTYGGASLVCRWLCVPISQSTFWIGLKSSVLPDSLSISTTECK